MKVIDFTRGLLSRVYQSCTSGPGSFFTEKKNQNTKQINLSGNRKFI